MLCYIKDMKTFQTLSKFDTTEYSLAEGENGQVTIYQKNAIELTTKYVGMWLIINKELYYISGATPNNDSIDLIIQEPIYAFSRQVEYDGSVTYGALLKNIIDDDFGVNCPDSEYKLSYLSSTNTDSTACNIETDDYGYIIPYEIFDDAKYSGVKIDFNFTNTNLEIAISTANYSTGSVVFDDGSTTLESESYDANFIAKVTVIHDLGQSEPEEGEESEDQYEVIDFYLSSDNRISTEPPLNRAKGIWKYYTASQDESPLAVAVGAFSHNNDNHKIEFRSLKRFALYQSIKMRLRNDVFNTIITSRVYSTGDDRYYYKCGNLAVTLTEKIDSESSENSEEIKHIKNRIAAMNSGGGGSILDSVYPVGSIYMSVNNTDPSTLFGGTWEQLKDRFLLAAGTTYSAGATGGEATHKLTTTEMPSHTHYIYGGNGDPPDWFGGSGNAYGIKQRTGTAYDYLQYVGGNGAHNNMPPYLVVYIWKRTA